MKQQLIANLAQHDIIAPKTFDYKNYFQKKQFKIQQTFTKPDSSPIIEIQTLYETPEVQNMQQMSYDLQQHIHSIQTVRLQQTGMKTNPFENPFEVSAADYDPEELARRRRPPSSYRRCMAMASPMYSQSQDTFDQQQLPMDEYDMHGEPDIIPNSYFQQQEQYYDD